MPEIRANAQHQVAFNGLGNLHVKRSVAISGVVKQTQLAECHHGRNTGAHMSSFQMRGCLLALPPGSLSHRLI